MIGLTGGIATGKSTVAQRLRELGAYVLDADIIAREVVEPHTPGWERVKEVFPEVIREDSTIDRKLLGDIIFSDAQAKKALEEIIHPLVIARMRSEGEAQERAGGWWYATSPLYESGSERWLDEVWVVYADPAAQLRRLMGRSNVNRKEPSR